MIFSNRIEVIKVIRIDKENNNIYLSRRQTILSDININKKITYS